ncbi:MAG: hypothetical protein LUI08_03180 [Prevotella sp.]|nr:hypothetical protein [Prevotella sp.]
MRFYAKPQTETVCSALHGFMDVDAHGSVKGSESISPGKNTDNWKPEEDDLDW